MQIRADRRFAARNLAPATAAAVSARI